ncbi:unnamed protein product [Caenorhabditis brenneri]
MHNQAASAAEATLLEGIDAFCGERYWDPAIWEVSTIPILSKCYQHTTLVCRPNPIPWTRRLQLEIGLSSILVADSLTLFSIVIYEMIFVYLNRITMWWFTSLCCLGVQKPLEISDLYSLNDGDTSNVLVPKWNKLWTKRQKDLEKMQDDHQQQKKSKSCGEYSPLLNDDDGDDGGSDPTPPSSEQKRIPSIIWSLFLMFKWDILAEMFVKLLSDVLLFCNPLLLKCLIRFTEHLDQPLWQAILLAFTEMSSILLSHYFYLMYRVGTRVQACLTAAVYRKTLRLSNSARREKNV